MSMTPDVVEELARRVATLEASEAIRRLMDEYALAADDRDGCSVNVERTMRLFARDGVWDGSPRFGRYEGWEAIRSNLSQGKAGIDWSLHHVVNLSLTVAPDLQTAAGRWYLMEAARMNNPKSGSPELVLLSGVYDNTFVREDGVWKLQLMRFDCQAIAGETGVWQSPTPVRAA